MPMRRLDIADHLGLTIESVSRLLNGFKRAGLVRSSIAKRGSNCWTCLAFATWPTADQRHSASTADMARREQCLAARPSLRCRYAAAPYLRRIVGNGQRAPTAERPSVLPPVVRKGASDVRSSSDCI
jgi:DNA-binding transcriptional regulator LsrR (DeoR family)